MSTCSNASSESKANPSTKIHLLELLVNQPDGYLLSQLPFAYKRHCGQDLRPAGSNDKLSQYLTKNFPNIAYVSGQGGSCMVALHPSAAITIASTPSGGASSNASSSTSKDSEPKQREEVSPHRTALALEAEYKQPTLQLLSDCLTEAESKTKLHLKRMGKQKQEQADRDRPVAQAVECLEREPFSLTSLPGAGKFDLPPQADFEVFRQAQLQRHVDEEQLNKVHEVISANAFRQVMKSIEPYARPKGSNGSWGSLAKKILHQGSLMVFMLLRYPLPDKQIAGFVHQYVVRCTATLLDSKFGRLTEEAETRYNQRKQKCSSKLALSKSLHQEADLEASADAQRQFYRLLFSRPEEQDRKVDEDGSLLGICRALLDMATATDRELTNVLDQPRRMMKTKMQAYMSTWDGYLSRSEQDLALFNSILEALETQGKRLSEEHQAKECQHKEMIAASAQTRPMDCSLEEWIHRELKAKDQFLTALEVRDEERHRFELWTKTAGIWRRFITAQKDRLMKYQELVRAGIELGEMTRTLVETSFDGVLDILQGRQRELRSKADGLEKDYCAFFIHGYMDLKVQVHLLELQRREAKHEMKAKELELKSALNMKQVSKVNRIKQELACMQQEQLKAEKEWEQRRKDIEFLDTEEVKALLAKHSLPHPAEQAAQQIESLDAEQQDLADQMNLLRGRSQPRLCQSSPGRARLQIEAAQPQPPAAEAGATSTTDDSDSDCESSAEGQHQPK